MIPLKFTTSTLSEPTTSQLPSTSPTSPASKTSSSQKLHSTQLGTTSTATLLNTAKVPTLPELSIENATITVTRCMDYAYLYIKKSNRDDTTSFSVNVMQDNISTLVI